MKKMAIGIIAVMCSMSQVIAQFDSSDKSITRRYDSKSIGIGLGIEYGSILGLQYTYYLNRKFGLVAAGGLVTNGVAGGVGVKYRPWMEGQPKFVTPYFVGMYGPVARSDFYANMVRETATFYGGHVGMGVEIRDKKWKRAFFKFTAHVSSDFGSHKDYKAELEARGISYSGSPRGYSISLGYNYAL